MMFVAKRLKGSPLYLSTSFSICRLSQTNVPGTPVCIYAIAAQDET